MPSTPTLLIVEDSDEDYELTCWALQQARFARPIRRFERVQETLDFLDLDRSRQDTWPCLVLLDINLPDGSGLEVLEHCRSNPVCTALPFVIHTTSKNPRDLERCYRLGAAGYIVKPMDRAAFARQIQSFVDYWFEAVLLPSPRA